MEYKSVEILRTYKNGLKLPASLINPFNELVREREILQFLVKSLNDGFSNNQLQRLTEVASRSITPENRKWKCFKLHKNLANSSKTVINEYKTIFNKNISFPIADLQKNLNSNRKLLEFFTRNRLRYDINLNLKGMINDPENPAPTEISMSDYQNIARTNLKRLCGNSHKYALNNINLLPYDETLTERKVTTILGNKANHLHSVSTQMSTMMNVNKDIRGKFNFIKTLLQDEDPNATYFHDVLPIYLSFYSVPKHFKNYIAKSWKVDSNWVRNTLVGWRRKLDPYLPKKMRVEPLTTFMDELAVYCKTFCESENEVKIISILQKKRVLHLLNSKIQLKFLVPKKLRIFYEELQAKIQFTDKIRELIDGYTQKIDVALFKKLNQELKNKILKDLEDVDNNSSRYKRSITFTNKLNALYENFNLFTELFTNYLPGNRFTSSVSKIIIHTLNKEGKNNKRIKRLFTALRGVISPAFAELFPKATALFREHFIPDKCITRPFTSNRKKKKFLPLELKSPKYVILRKKHPKDKEYINNQETTKLFKENQPLWLGFNIYTPDQFLDDGNIRGQNKGTLWFRLLPTKKIMKCLKKGAVVKSIRLNVPKGASNKIIADITLGAGSRAPFIRSSQFLKTWEQKYVNSNIPNSVYLGKDLNRIGKFMIALANSTETIDISEIMAEFERAYKKLELYRKKIIPNIQRNLILKKDGLNGRRKTEITSIHNKKHKFMKEYNQRVLMMYLYAIYKSNARHASWDGIEGITTRGKKKGFAISIQYLPNNLDQFKIFCEWLDDLKFKELIDENTKIHLVSPYTSAVCPKCYSNSGKLNKNRDKRVDYHEFKCKKCGFVENRHSSAAMVEAISVKIAVEGIT